MTRNKKYEYINISEINNISEVIINDIESFLFFAENHGAREIFRINREDRNEFAIIINHIAYRINLRGYHSAEDYCEANAGGFPAAEEYYEAIKGGYSSYRELTESKKAGIENK